MKQVKLNPQLLHEQAQAIAEQREQTNQHLFMALNNKVNLLNDSVQKLAFKEDLTQEVRKRMENIK